MGSTGELLFPTFYKLRPRLGNVPVEDDRFFLVAGVRDLHVADAEAVNRSRFAVEEDFHLQRRSGRHVEILGNELAALSDANSQHWLGGFALHPGRDVEVPEARTEVKAAASNQDSDILLGFLEADRQNVSAGDRVRLISRGVGADRHGYALNADDLLLASAFQNNFMIECSLVLRRRGGKGKEQNNIAVRNQSNCPEFVALRRRTASDRLEVPLTVNLLTTRIIPQS